MKRKGPSSDFSITHNKRPKTSQSSSSFRPGWPSFTRVTPLSEHIIEQRVRMAHLDRHASLPEFQYCPLKEGTNEIRLLHITRQSRQGTLFGRLEHAPLDEASYETISYCWGDPTPCRALVVNGARLLIPKSSWQALNRLAYDDKEQTLWIDAVCINQQDKAERGHQVALMQEVYSLGIRNIVYLGEPVNDESMADAFATIQALHMESQADTVFQEQLGRLGIYDMGRSNSPIQIKWNETAIHESFSNPWFSRLWVLQETCLALENLCVLGKFELDFRVILEVAVWFRVYHSPHISSELFSLPGLINATDALYVHERYRHHRGLPLSNPLELGQAEASDPRDRVYGLLGLLSEDMREVETLRPDYRKSWQDVYADAMIEALRDSEGDALRLISHRNEAELSANGLPSWVPRFQRKSDRSVDTASFSHFGNTPMVQIRTDGLGQVLRLEGWVISTVSSVSDVAAFHSSTYADKLRWFGQVAAMAQSVARESHDILARTLMADCNCQKQRSIAEERLEYLTLVEYHANGRSVPNLSDLRYVHLHSRDMTPHEQDYHGPDGRQAVFVSAAAWR